MNPIHNDAFLLKITGPGLTFEREISASDAAQITAALIGAQVAAPPSGVTNKPPLAPTASKSTPQIAQTTHAQNKTARGYLNQYKPKRVPDKIACLALYLKEVEGRPNFTRDDLKRVFQQAAERIPANLGGRDLKWAQEADWVAPTSEDKDLFYLTHAGEAAVCSEFSDEILAKSRFKAPVARRRNEPKPGTNKNKAPGNATEQA